PSASFISLLSLHDALPILRCRSLVPWSLRRVRHGASAIARDKIGAAIVRHHNFTGDGMFTASLPSFLNATCQRILLVEAGNDYRSEEHTSELQSRFDLVCR